MSGDGFSVELLLASSYQFTSNFFIGMRILDELNASLNYENRQIELRHILYYFKIRATMNKDKWKFHLAKVHCAPLIHSPLNKVCPYEGVQVGVKYHKDSIGLVVTNANKSHKHILPCIYSTIVLSNNMKYLYAPLKRVFYQLSYPINQLEQKTSVSFHSMKRVNSVLDV